MRLMLLSLRPTRGTIRVFGQDAAALSKDGLTTLRRRIGADMRLPLVSLVIACTHQAHQERCRAVCGTRTRSHMSLRRTTLVPGRRPPRAGQAVRAMDLYSK